LTLVLVRDMREPSSADEVADFETGVLAGFDDRFSAAQL
jgi:hypothetical protein